MFLYNFRVFFIFFLHFKGEDQLINGMLMDFHEVSPILKELCAKLHQKLLVPRKSQDWKIIINEAEEIIDFYDK